MLRKLFNFRRFLKGGVLEAPWDYRARTGRLLFDAFKDSGVAPVWRKAFQSVYKQTWRENKYLIEGENLLTAIRTDRPRIWWAGLATTPASQRETGSTKRRRTGPVRMWALEWIGDTA